ncbi:hypothetical protein LCGC14_2871960 [marine sediment metagenome]|uniref:Uncharacterized protein n=1 Tax=marine sediment metagenome TaxID=412755 RepID=A0A0F8Y2J7_9ZZZZ
MADPHAAEIVELQSERLTLQAGLDAYGIMGIAKMNGSDLLQVAVEIVARSEGAKAFLRVFEALSEPGVGAIVVTRDGNKTKIAVYTACSSAQAKKALDGAGGAL